jgi:hypothetical protein
LETDIAIDTEKLQRCNSKILDAGGAFGLRTRFQLASD